MDDLNKNKEKKPGSDSDDDITDNPQQLVKFLIMTSKDDKFKA